MRGRYSGSLKVEVRSKEIGTGKLTTHRIGTKCIVERNQSNMGQFILWFGSKRISKVDAVKLQDVVAVSFANGCEEPITRSDPVSPAPPRVAEAASGCCSLGCTDVCKAKEHGCASECPALPWQPKGI